LNIVDEASKLRNDFISEIMHQDNFDHLIDSEQEDMEKEEDDKNATSQAKNQQKLQDALHFDLGTPETVLNHAKDLAQRSVSEFWLSYYLDKSTNDANENILQNLENVLDQAEKNHANSNLLAKAKAILTKAKAEAQLKMAISNMPTVRLPLAQYPPDYWQPEDIGHLAEITTQDDSETPPISVQWIPAKSFSDFSNALNNLHNALTSATHANADSAILSQAQQLHHTASDDLKQLERKDAEDREIAQAQAEKAAAKKNKTKKKSPPSAGGQGASKSTASTKNTSRK